MSVPRLSIIVPIYNEERTIAVVIDKLHEIFSTDTEIIFVDDGSADRSLAIVEEKARPSDIVLTKENGGKGSAVRLGLTKTSAPFTVIQDADLEYDPAEIRTLLRSAEEHPGTIVFGSRFLQKNPNIYKRNYIGNRLITAILDILFLGTLTDSYTCYKLFPTAILRSFPLTAQSFELEAELSAWPLKRGIPIREVPIRYAPRSHEEGKKIRAKDAWKGLLTMLRIRFARSS
ncbi:MAG: glycosyltransferase family 2 protein [Patescibacteria group bacterium]